MHVYILIFAYLVGTTLIYKCSSLLTVKCEHCFSFSIVTLFSMHLCFIDDDKTYYPFILNHGLVWRSRYSETEFMFFEWSAGTVSATLGPKKHIYSKTVVVILLICVTCTTSAFLAIWLLNFDYWFENHTHIKAWFYWFDFLCLTRENKLFVE